MDMQDDATFGDALRAAIESAGYTQARLAKDLDIDAGQVSRWVNNRVIPHAPVVEKIGQILGADLSPEFSLSAEYELFVSAPISGLHPDRVAAHNEAVRKVVTAARGHVPSLYWPGDHIHRLDDLSAPDIATERNMKVLEHCSAFLYLQFDEVIRPSGALIELGCALGRRVKTTAMIAKDLPLPFMLQNFEGVAAAVNFLPKARVYEVRSVDHACDLIAKDGRELLGLAGQRGRGQQHGTG
jgi:transcriptional regulator with XRE-family HTH domain